MQDAVLPHVVSSIVPGVEVLFLDTGLHFAETLATRARVARQLPLRVLDVRPRQSVQVQDREFGPALHERDPGLCCFLRKVEPLARALEPYAAWVTGVRRDDSPTRSQTAVVAWDDAHDLLKVNPLVRWTTEQLLAYEDEHDLVRNPLRDNGFPQHRVRALHPARRAARGPPLRPVVGSRQDGVRHPRLSRTGDVRPDVAGLSDNALLCVQR